MHERLKMLRNVFVCLRRQGTGLTKSVSNSRHSQKLGTYAEHTLTQMHEQITYTHKHAHIQQDSVSLVSPSSCLFFVFSRSKLPKIGRLGRLRKRLSRFGRKFFSCFGRYAAGSLSFYLYLKTDLVVTLHVPIWSLEMKFTVFDANTLRYR